MIEREFRNTPAPSYMHKSWQWLVTPNARGNWHFFALYLESSYAEQDWIISGRAWVLQ